MWARLDIKLFNLNARSQSGSGFSRILHLIWIPPRFSSAHRLHLQDNSWWAKYKNPKKSLPEMWFLVHCGFLQVHNKTFCYFGSFRFAVQKPLWEVWWKQGNFSLWGVEVNSDNQTWESTHRANLWDVLKTKLHMFLQWSALLTAEFIFIPTLLIDTQNCGLNWSKEWKTHLNWNKLLKVFWDGSNYRLLQNSVREGVIINIESGTHHTWPPSCCLMNMESYRMLGELQPSFTCVPKFTIFTILTKFHKFYQIS